MQGINNLALKGFAMELRKILPLTAAALLCFALCLAGCSASSTTETVKDAVYNGVKDYGTVTSEDKDNFTHLFTVEDEQKEYAVSTDGNYSVQNTLQEGYSYDLIVTDGVVTEATPLQSEADTDAYVPTTRGEAGLKTLKNYLATALEPVGITLYVYGGGWNWQDTASSNQTMTIGLPQSWIDFFFQQDASYNYKGEDAATSYYPYNGWNQYYYAGADCSGYLGWTLYNTLETEDATVADNEGYVTSAAKMASSLADAGLGTFTQQIDADSFKPGDIISIKGHVWTVVGTCKDDSIVIAHSTASDSKTDGAGGGVQLSALNPTSDTDTDCEAYKLVCQYMETYFPDWSERYNAVLKPYSEYTTLDGETCGKFSWNLEGEFTDPDGYANMSAKEILADLFDEA